MPRKHSLRAHVIKAMLIALACFAAFILSEFAQSPVTFLYALLLPVYWLVLCGIAIYRFRRRGLWVLLGAPLALALPYEILHHLIACHRGPCM
jgi:hypothetical protein